MPSSPTTTPKTCWEKLRVKNRKGSRKRTALAVVLEGRILRDDEKDLGHKKGGLTN